MSFCGGIFDCFDEKKKSRDLEYKEASLWDRMGGEEIVKPLCNELYERHASDPITKPWFSSSGDHEWNIRTPDEIKEHVFTFFSAGIGGPHEYKGRDMVETHKKFAELKPLTQSSVHALVYHVLEMMKKHGSGGDKEIDEVYDILMSIVPDVTKFGTAKFEPSEVSLWDRMGGAKVIEPLCNELYDRHASDPLTRDWFASTGEHAWNSRTPEEVKHYVYTFFSAGIGGPLEYTGRSMIDAHAGMREMKPFTKASVHALMYHVIEMMKKHTAGGNRESDEVLAILESLRSHVVQGVE